MKKYSKWIVCLLSITIFIILAILVKTSNDIFLDSFVYNFISKYITDNLTSIVKYLTYIGSGIVVIGITIFVFIFFKNKKYSLYMSINLISITILQLILKNIFSRERPIDINLIEETGYSFPSGHSLTSMAFYGFLIYLIHISNLNKRSKIIFTTLFTIFIVVTGFSRIYLGVHYFTDVLGGFTFSLAYLIVFTSIVRERLK